MNTPRFRPLAAVLALALLIAGAILLITSPGDDEPPAPRPAPAVGVVTQPLGAPAVARPDVPNEIRIPAPALAEAKRSGADDHGGERDELPDGVPADQIREGQVQQDELAQRDDLPVVTPAAAPEQAGCRSRFVRNYSSRRGVRPRIFVLHYTVSPNRAGWGDVDGITGLFNTPSFAASSNYVVDDEGHCNYIVRESDKSWTQATFNPVSISVEIIATGREGRLSSATGIAKIGRIVSDATKRWGIPLQTGAVSGCTVTRPGIVTHQMLGGCGGGHVDISPYSASPVLTAAKRARAGAAVGTAADRLLCRKLQWWRANRKTAGTKARTNAIARRKALEVRGLRCTTAGKLVRR